MSILRTMTRERLRNSGANKHQVSELYKKLRVRVVETKVKKKKIKRI